MLSGTMFVPFLAIPLLTWYRSYVAGETASKLAIMYLLLVVLIVSLSQQGQKPLTKESEKDGKQTVAQQQAQGQKLNPVAVQSNIQCECTKNKSDSSKDESKDRLYRTYLISGPIAAVLSVGTIILVWRQIITLRRVERAWVVLSVLKPPDHLSWLKIANFVSKIETTLQFTNIGNTPAILENIFVSIQVLDEKQELCEIPEYDKSKLPQHPDIPKYGRILAPKESMESECIFKGSGGAITFQDEIQSVIDNKRTAVLFGIVKYSDAFGGGHEFRFCYFWHARRSDGTGALPAGFRLGGPAEYNKAT